MKIKILVLIVLSFFSFCLFPGIVRADEVSDLQKQISEYEKQISVLQKQVDSLSQQISLMDNQIKIASLKIIQTENQIKTLEKEIGLLSGKILQLDGSLNYLSKVLLERIKEHNLPVEQFAWYLDLRKYGSVPHSGFGYGLERLVAWICGLEHIRETIPFPRLINRINP